MGLLQRLTKIRRSLARSVALVVTPGPPWVVGETITLKATVTDDGVPAVGELVRFDILIYVNGTVSYDLPNGTTDALGVASIDWVIPAVRGDTPVSGQNVGFRAFDNATMTSSNLVRGYVAPGKSGTSVSINVSPTSGNVPLTVNISGKIIDSTGLPLSKTINLYVNATLVDTFTTSITGNYVFSVNITAAGTYQFQIEFLGDAYYEGCTAHNGTHAVVSEVPQFPWWILGLIAGGFVLAVVVSKGR